MQGHENIQTIVGNLRVRPSSERQWSNHQTVSHRSSHHGSPSPWSNYSRRSPYVYHRYDAEVEKRLGELNQGCKLIAVQVTSRPERSYRKRVWTSDWVYIMFTALQKTSLNCSGLMLMLFVLLYICHTTFLSNNKKCAVQNRHLHLLYELIKSSSKSDKLCGENNKIITSYYPAINT